METVNTAISKKARGVIDDKMKKLKRAKVSNHKWKLTYELFKGAKLTFYCQKSAKEEHPIISIGMTHRTVNGMILMLMDVANGGNPYGFFLKPTWEKWVQVLPYHYCIRYAERIMNVDPTFENGVDGIMYADNAGVASVTDRMAEHVDEIEFQFKDGQSYGWRDNSKKITYFKTVYSNDMLKGDRKEFQDQWKETLDQVSKLFDLG